MSPLFNERQTRAWAATEAQSLGWGGISTVSISTGLSRTTVSAGIDEIRDGYDLPVTQIRRKGGGRKRAEMHYPSLRSNILKIVDPATRGDPESNLCWSSKSLVKIVNTLKADNSNWDVGVSVVQRILHEEGYSMQANCKTKEGGDHPDRDAQFNRISKLSNQHQQEGNPVISIDGKKKELIGDYKNGGQEWHPKGEPIHVKVYDFKLKDGIKAVPYGIYDIARNKGFVNIGISADTSVFAGRSILQWWDEEGRNAYPNANHLLITSDGGGSNSSRSRLWKVILQELANKIGFPITVCHYPPGTSKWNKIEHCLFGPISTNWRGEPLVSLDKMVELISNTTNKGGLQVTCTLDTREYQRGIKISDKWMASLNLERDEFQGKWNYTISCDIAKP